MCQSISWRPLLERRHHPGREQLETAQREPLGDSGVRVPEEQVLKAAHLDELVDALGHVLRRADQQVPGLEELPVEPGARRQLLAGVGEDVPAPEGIVVDEGRQDGLPGLPARRLRRRRQVPVAQNRLALGEGHDPALDLGSDLRVELHALADPARWRLPVAGTEAQLRREADRPVRGHGHPERRVRLLEWLGGDAQLQDPVAVLPVGIRRV